MEVRREIRRTKRKKKESTKQNKRHKTNRVGVGIMSQLGIVALFLEMDYLRMMKIAPE